MCKSREYQRELEELALRYGFSVEITKNNHYRLAKEGCKLVFASKTPSCPYVLRKVEQDLKRSSGHGI